ncbi:hypothetical protein DH2020_041998 [Rehmannia glutinosa]|uniref:Myb/SANT-like domain-containing protein n=1 Tax=Rehmannia glutinosa TaxID=99300 RepID=A0ABR0UPM9_REHGL
MGYGKIPTVASFLELMYIQFQEGQLLTSTFSDQTWKTIGKELFDRHNVNAPQLKGKACRLRILWRKFHNLITKKTGFGWDPLSGTMTAPEEYWTSWIAENPEEASLRKKGLPHYDLCTEMFSKSVATGAFARSSVFGPLDSDEEGDLDPTYKVTTQTEGIPLGVGTPTSLDPLQQPSSLYKASDKKAAKSTRSSRLDEAIDAWTSVNKESVKRMKKKSNDVVEDCMAALEAMEGLSEKKFFLAQDAFLKRTRRKMFLLMNEDKKRKWVESLGEP